MSGHGSHPFTTYNQQNECRTWVGNWYEEEALKGVTGQTRCESRSPGRAGSSTSQVAPSCPPSSSTFKRVVEHSDQLEPNKWQTVKQSFHMPPAQAVATLPGQLQQHDGLGPRARMELAAMAAEARQEPPEAPAAGCYETTSRAELPAHDLAGISVGTKVMKDRDGKPTRRDTLFLQEMKLAEPRVAARIEARQQAGGLLLGGSMPCSSYDTPCDPLQEAAVTFYSEAVATGVYGHSVHGTHRMHEPGRSGFGRDTTFSKPITELGKLVLDE